MHDQVFIRQLELDILFAAAGDEFVAQRRGDAFGIDDRAGPFDDDPVEPGGGAPVEAVVAGDPRQPFGVEDGAAAGLRRIGHDSVAADTVAFGAEAVEQVGQAHGGVFEGNAVAQGQWRRLAGLRRRWRRGEYRDRGNRNHEPAHQALKLGQDHLSPPTASG